METSNFTRAEHTFDKLAGKTGESAGLNIKVFYDNKILRNRLEFKGILQKWRPVIDSRGARSVEANIPLS